MLLYFSCNFSVILRCFYRIFCKTDGFGEIYSLTEESFSIARFYFCRVKRVELNNIETILFILSELFQNQLAKDFRTSHVAQNVFDML